jgi:chemotaxis receptor (MCP) glutamine deamidase CheD
MTLEKIFRSETRNKEILNVYQDNAIVNNSSYLYTVTLGSCVSVVLCGEDSKGELWFGVNHMFKSRDDNTDVALQHVADLYNKLMGNNIERIKCLGVFGASYRKGSFVKNVATKNIMTIIEALSLYNLSIELYQTGFSQHISFYKSSSLNSILIKHYNINEKATKIIEIPLDTFFDT